MRPICVTVYYGASFTSFRTLGPFPSVEDAIHGLTEFAQLFAPEDMISTNPKDYVFGRFYEVAGSSGITHAVLSPLEPASIQELVPGLSQALMN